MVVDSIEGELFRLHFLRNFQSRSYPSANSFVFFVTKLIFVRHYRVLTGIYLLEAALSMGCVPYITQLSLAD